MSLKPSFLPLRFGIYMALFCTLTHSASAETLDSAVEAALNHHPSVEAAVANRDAFSQEKREQWADHFPSLNVRGAGGRIYGDNSTSRGLTVTRGAAYSYLWEGSVTLTQPIFDGFETFNRVDAAQMRRDSANLTITDVREGLAARTAIAYMDVLRSREILGRINKHEKVIDDYQGRIKSMVDEGAADESMIVQARDIKAQLQSTKADIEGQLKAANAEFAELTGYMPEGEMENPVPRLDLIPDTAEQAVAFAKNNHPALKAAKFTEEALGYEAEAEEQFYYPDVNGELSYLQRDQEDVIGGETIDAKAVVRVNWDLSTAGGQFARVKKARHRQYESKAQRAETERAIERDVRIAYHDMDTAKRKQDIDTDRVKINEDLFSTYESQFEVARINLLQLLQSDNALFNARLSALNSRYAVLTSQFALLASMGKLQDAMNIVASEGKGE